MTEVDTSRPLKKRKREKAGLSEKNQLVKETPNKIKRCAEEVEKKFAVAEQVELATHISDTLSDKPKASKLVVLLTEGLRKGDEQLLNAVLHTRDESVISSILRHIPAQLVPALVREVGSRMRATVQTDLALARWLRVALLQHSSYLTSFPELVETVRELSGVTEVKASNPGLFGSLQGKLNLLLSQVALQRGLDSSHPAVLQYSDDGSSDSEDNIPLFERSEDEDVVRWTDDGCSEEENDTTSDEG